MRLKSLIKDEDWLVVWMGFILLASSAFLPAFPKIGVWSFDAFVSLDSSAYVNMLLLFIIFLTLFTFSIYLQGKKIKRFILSFFILFILALLTKLLASFELSKSYGFGYAFWALFIGLFISNTLGIKPWIKENLKTELMIKTGLVLLGAEILFSKMAQLGLPALSVAWFVTPIVILFMYYLGTRYLKLDDKLSIVVATATSVCGVSAAIACSAACEAKKETLMLATSMTLIFTVIMMVLMPFIVQVLGLSPLIGGAWIGGTIDSTGAVVAAGAVLGKDAMDVAAIVKMVQNIMVGAVAFVVAIIWAKKQSKAHTKMAKIKEIWVRFPKFIIGFIAASLIFSFIIYPLYGESVVNEVLNISKSYRGLLFTLAFLSIGLEANFKELSAQLHKGQPVYLYLIGQSFNIVLTLGVAYLAFGGFFYDLSH